VAKRAETNVERYRQLERETARQLGVKATDDLVQHVATLRLGREALAAKMITGDDTANPSDLLKFDEALRAYMPAAKPVSVTLTHLVHCPECGAALIKNAPLPVTSIEAAVHVETPRAEIDAPRTPVIDLEAPPPKPKPKPEKPYHETAVRDSRPNAPVSLNGSVVWWGGPGK
jgi:hypothetical protein